MKPILQIKIALLKLGFSEKSILNMSESEAIANIEAYYDIINPAKSITYKVRKK
jgi:hypothetical protein